MSSTRRTRNFFGSCSAATCAASCISRSRFSPCKCDSPPTPRTGEQPGYGIIKGTYTVCMVSNYHSTLWEPTSTSGAAPDAQAFGRSNPGIVCLGRNGRGAGVGNNPVRAPIGASRTHCAAQKTGSRQAHHVGRECTGRETTGDLTPSVQHAFCFRHLHLMIGTCSGRAEHTLTLVMRLKKGLPAA